MPTQINININGFGVGGSSGDRVALDYSERSHGDRVEGDRRWEDEFYTLKPRFSPVGYLHAERKLKKKKAKNCSNGQVCGFSCISKSKVCKANMTTAQLMEHNKAKRLEKAEKRKPATLNDLAKGKTREEFLSKSVDWIKTNPDYFANVDKMIADTESTIAGTRKNASKQIKTLNDRLDSLNTLKNNMQNVKTLEDMDKTIFAETRLTRKGETQYNDGISFPFTPMSADLGMIWQEAQRSLERDIVWQFYLQKMDEAKRIVEMEPQSGESFI